MEGDKFAVVDYSVMRTTSSRLCDLSSVGFETGTNLKLVREKEKIDCSAALGSGAGRRPISGREVSQIPAEA